MKFNKVYCSFYLFCCCIFIITHGSDGDGGHDEDGITTTEIVLTPFQHCFNMCRKSCQVSWEFLQCRKTCMPICMSRSRDLLLGVVNANRNGNIILSNQRPRRRRRKTTTVLY